MVPLLALALLVDTAGAPATAATIRMQVVVHTSVDAANLTRARETAIALLTSGGIVGEWTDCRPPGPCSASDQDGVPTLIVRLMPLARRSDGEVCGDLVVDPLTGARTILVYLRSVDETLRAIRISPLDRSDPTVATIQHGHLIGFTIAHEVGHALGLRHSAVGVMKARLDMGDIVALRASRLVFMPQQAASMRLTVQAAHDGCARIPASCQ